MLLKGLLFGIAKVVEVTFMVLRQSMRRAKGVPASAFHPKKANLLIALKALLLIALFLLDRLLNLYIFLLLLIFLLRTAGICPDVSLYFCHAFLHVLPK